MAIKWTKQASKTFLLSGDLPVGTRTVMVYIDGVKTVGGASPAKETVKTITEIIEHSFALPAQVYEIREVDIDPPELIAKRTAQLIKARKAKQEKAKQEKGGADEGEVTCERYSESDD